MKHEPLFQVLTEIIEGICQDHLDETRIYTDNLKGVETLIVMPHMADYPKLIGKEGLQVNAFNYLVQRAARRLGIRLGISIKESFIGEREPIEAFAYNPNFDVADFEEKLSRLMSSVTGENIPLTVTSQEAMVIVKYPCERGSENESLGSAMTKVLRPYVFRMGRSLYIKPQFINYDNTNQTHAAA